MEPITIHDLILINNLSSRTYSGNRLLSNASEEEKRHLEVVTSRLRILADYFSNKYSQAYGPFETSVTTGNDIQIGGTKFKRIWSGIFKGATNKQYAAQISFVMNPNEACLDVGFYFGRAMGHSLNREQKLEMERNLNNLGISLSDAIINDTVIQSRYNSLFDFGFTTYSNGNAVLADDWYNIIRTNTSNSQIIAKIFPNDFGVIENSTIDSFVAQVIFLMSAIRDVNVTHGPIIIKPLTPEQRAKQAERLAQIGLKGELYILEQERNKLINLNLSAPQYPRHVALESTHYGYDILSLDEKGQEIFIEVKTTTRTRDDANSRKFFVSANEYHVFSNNKSKYKLHRVYDIENSPSFDELDIDELMKYPDGYIMEY